MSLVCVPAPVRACVLSAVEICDLNLDRGMRPNLNIQFTICGSRVALGCSVGRSRSRACGRAGVRPEPIPEPLTSRALTTREDAS